MSTARRQRRSSTQTGHARLEPQDAVAERPTPGHRRDRAHSAGCGTRWTASTRRRPTSRSTRCSPRSPSRPAIRDVVLPYLHDLGDRWAAGPADIATEHFASSVIRRRLSASRRSPGAWAPVPSLSSPAHPANCTTSRCSPSASSSAGPGGGCATSARTPRCPRWPPRAGPSRRPRRPRRRPGRRCSSPMRRRYVSSRGASPSPSPAPARARRSRTTSVRTFLEGDPVSASAEAREILARSGARRLPAKEAGVDRRRGGQSGGRRVR